MRTELVSFGEDTLIALRSEGAGWLAINRCCEALGLDGNAQKKRIERSAWAIGRTSIMDVQIAGDDQPRPVFCLSIDRVAAWLASIEVSRIKDPAIKAKLARYQNEAADVLDRWFRGSAPQLAAPSPSPFDLMQQMLDSMRSQAARVERVEQQQAQIAATQAAHTTQLSMIADAQRAAAASVPALPAQADPPDVSNRTRANKLVRAFCVAFGQDHQVTWKMVYGRLKDHYGIDLYARSARRHRMQKLDIVDADNLWPQLFAVLQKYLQEPLDKLNASISRRPAA